MKTQKTIVVIVTMLSVTTALMAQKTEVGFRIVVDPRIELMNIALTFTDLPYFGKISDHDYKYYQDVIQHFSAHKDHEAIRECATDPYFRDISFPDQMVLYLSDPPEMKMKYNPPANVPREVIADMQRIVDLLNRFADDTKFMKFWEDHGDYYTSLIASLENKLPYREYLARVKEFYGVRASEFVCVVSPILYGAAFGPALDIGGRRIPYFVTGPNRIEKGQPVFTDSWLRLLVFHEYGHSFVNPLCERYRESIMSRDSLLKYFNKNAVIRKIYDNWFTVVHEHITRAGETYLLRKTGLETESNENLKRNLDQGFVLVPAILSKLEYYDSHRDKYPTFESYFPELLQIFDENYTSLAENQENSGVAGGRGTKSEPTRNEIGGLKDEQLIQIVHEFFKYFNSKNLASLRTIVHQRVRVSGNVGDVAFLILKSAMEQLPTVTNHVVNSIDKGNGDIKIVGKYKTGDDDSDFTFHIDGDGKITTIDMFKVNAQVK